MNAVLYYSNTGESRKIANYAADFLHWNALALQSCDGEAYERAVLVFPVHCQDIPIAIQPVLQNLRIKQAVILVSYGKMSYGNVLFQCAKKYKLHIVGGAYIPTKHSYIPEDTSFEELQKLNPVLEKLHHPTTVLIPRSIKNPLAAVFPLLRSRLGITLTKSRACTDCGLCKSVCDNKKCIRCLKCVKCCPQNALQFRPTLFMKWYLKKTPKNELVLYK